MKKAINKNSSIKVFAGVAILAFGACSSNQKKESRIVADTAINVTVATPSSDKDDGITLSGQVEAAQSANLSTRVMGYITKVNVKVGDEVKKGQLLASISNDDILAKRAQGDAMITEAEAGFKNAQKDLDRFTALYKQQSASAKELDNVTLQYSSAKARLEAAKQMRNEVNATLNYTSLKAPFAGVITQKLADAGSMASPGMPILTIEQSGSYQVSASVPENSIKQIKEGAPAVITVNAVNKTIRGTISQINQSSAFTGGQYIIKIQINNTDKKGLLAGMYADVSIPLEKTAGVTSNENQVIVPLNSIEHKDELTGLYTVGNNHTALLRWVRLGKVEGNQVEVLSGLAPHEQFIAGADGRLYNGASVKINK